MAIERRLRALDEEWDIERCVETMAPTFTLLGLGLGLTRHRAWFALPVIVQGFFLQHALRMVPAHSRLAEFGCSHDGRD